MKRTIITIIIITMTALALLLAGATPADAHGRGAAAFPLVPQSSASGQDDEGSLRLQLFTPKCGPVR